MTGVTRIFWIAFFVVFGLSLPVCSQAAEPSDEEQYLLELINRARMNPAAEGEWLANHPDRFIQNSYEYFSVDLNALIQEFKTYSPVPPLAFNPALIEAARRHSKDLKDNHFQDHTGSDGSTGGDRLTEAGYDWWSYGENVFSYVENVDHAHAGFLADWGVPDLGHRKNTLEFDREPIWEEIGIGISSTASGDLAGKRLRRDKSFSAGNHLYGVDAVGPMLVTIDFARTWVYTPKVLGVVYGDLDGNEFYGPGEGYGGVTVSVVGTGESAVTYSSGGYSIPVAVPGEYVLQVSGGLLGETVTKSFTIDSHNIKVDFLTGEDLRIPDWALY